MKKEIFIAIIIGLFFGLLITYGVYRTRLALTQNTTNLDQTEINPSPELLTDTSNITVFSPEDGLIQENKELTISGTSLPNSYVILFVNNEDYISTADDTGNFSFNVILENGSNVLKVHAIDENGTTTTVQRTVIVYQNSQTSTPSASPTARPNR